MSDGTEPRTEEQKGAKGMHKAAGYTPAQLLFHVRPDPLKLIAQGPSEKRSCYPLNILAMGVPNRKIYSKIIFAEIFKKIKQKNYETETACPKRKSSFTYHLDKTTQQNAQATHIQNRKALLHSYF